MVAQGAEWRGKIWVVGFEVIEFWNVYQEVSLHIFVLWGPDPFFMFVDDCVLVRVVIGNSTWQGSEEIGEEIGFREDREMKGTVRRSRRGR